jgi:lipase chaperone LimK
MDYDSLLSEAKEDKEKLWERLSERLDRLQPDKILERKANEAEQLNKALQFRPLGHNWNVI